MRFSSRLLFLTTTPLILAATAPSANQSETCTNPQLSCSTSTSSNTCCLESQGLIQQVQFWDTDPVTGPTSSWTIHGLWPNACSGTYSENCDASRAYTNITQILDATGASDLVSYMQTYWVSNSESAEAFWEHEWATHGTCFSTLDTDCYPDYVVGDEVVDFFSRTVDLFQGLDTYQILSDAGITPSSSKTYQLSDMNDALESAFGAPVVLQCESSDVVYEIYYGFHVKGSVQAGSFVPAAQTGQSSNCPDTVKYPPKN